MKNRLVEEWIAKAESDCWAALMFIKSKRKGAPDHAAFHAEQCAEKYLKAFLQKERLRFPKTHNLIELLKLACSKEGTFELLRDLMADLNAFSVTFRYPGEWALRADARRAVKAMKEIRKFFRVRLNLR